MPLTLTPPPPYPDDMAEAERRRMSVTIDVDNLAAVKELLGTKSATETINAALQKILDGEERVRLAKEFFDGDGCDIRDPEVMAKAWRR